MLENENLLKENYEMKKSHNFMNNLLKEKIEENDKILFEKNKLSETIELIINENELYREKIEDFAKNDKLRKEKKKKKGNFKN